MKIYRIPKLVQYIFPNILWSFPGQENSIFLTFDDGPHETFTPQILDIFDKHMAKASFFLLGTNIKGNEKIMQRMHDSGHSIGIHSYEHISLLGKSKTEINDQISRTRDIIENIISEPVKFFRPPYGKFNFDLIKQCHSLSLQLVMWSFMIYDFDMEISEKKLINIFQKKIRAGDIVVLHDGHKNSDRTVRVLEEIIGICGKRGFELKAIRSL